MIQMFEYSAKQVDLIYSVVEDAVRTRKPIDLDRVCRFLKAGDFYLRGAGDIFFTFNGLKWVRDGHIYICLIKPQIYAENPVPVWIPVITVDDRDHSSSGDLSMIKKENRYLNTERNWAMVE